MAVQLLIYSHAYQGNRAPYKGQKAAAQRFVRLFSPGGGAGGGGQEVLSSLRPRHGQQSRELDVAPAALLAGTSLARLKENRAGAVPGRPLESSDKCRVSNVPCTRARSGYYRSSQK